MRAARQSQAVMNRSFWSRGVAAHQIKATQLIPTVPLLGYAPSIALA